MDDWNQLTLEKMFTSHDVKDVGHTSQFGASVDKTLTI